MTILIALAAVTAVAAAVRSTWSPCGLSMLSSITPLAEAGRGRRFGVTASWFLAGAIVGGLMLGGLAAAGAVLLGAAGWSASIALMAAAVAALITAAFDAGAVPPAIPHHRRQVNELWLNRYRGWVYGFGFGWQIGVGVATYIMTAAVYLTFVLAALTTSPAIALVLGGLFGTARGLAIFLGAKSTSPAALMSFHRRFDALAEPVRLAVLGVQLVVAVMAAVGAWGVASPGAAVVAVVAMGLAAVGLRRPVDNSCAVPGAAAGTGASAGTGTATAIRA